MMVSAILAFSAVREKGICERIAGQQVLAGRRPVVEAVDEWEGAV